MCRPSLDMSVSPKHASIQMATVLKLRDMADSDTFKVRYTGAATQLSTDQCANPQPEWFHRFLDEFGLQRDATIYDGMTATITKAEFRELFQSPIFNECVDNHSGRKKKSMVYGNIYTRTAGLQADRQADPKGNITQPLIAGTAHTVQGRELSADGRAFILYNSNEWGSGGWEMDFCKNSVYVSATRIRRRDQLYLVDVEDLVATDLGDLGEF